MEKPKTAPVIHERPKMPRATWDALRSHIIKERRRKQEEEGKAEEYERLKKEKEKKKMLEATSLDETKKQITQLEEKLTALKEEKHQLFLTLKKVLNEDENRKRKEISEHNSMYGAAHGAPVFPLTGHVAQNNPQLAAMYLHPQSRQPAMYLKPHSALPQPPGQSIKRQRTPSPSPPRPPASLSSAHFRTIPTTHGRQSSYAHPGHGAAYVTAMSGAAGASFHFPSSSSGAREDERKTPLYLPGPHGQVRYGAVEAKAERERGRLAVAPPAHVQPMALTTTRAGSITSGYPVHSLALASQPRMSYNQVAQHMAAQQAAVQAAASGGPPTTRYYTGTLHGREV